MLEDYLGGSAKTEEGTGVCGAHLAGPLKQQLGDTAAASRERAAALALAHEYKPAQDVELYLKGMSAREKRKQFAEALDMMLIGMAMAAAPALVSAQVSLATVVDLAQRNSSAVRLAEADVNKSRLSGSDQGCLYSEPSFDSGLPGYPPWLSRHAAFHCDRHHAVGGFQLSSKQYI